MSEETERLYVGGMDSQVVIGDGDPCPHPGCSSHASNPCEGCGRILARGNSILMIVGGRLVGFWKEPSTGLSDFVNGELTPLEKMLEPIRSASVGFPVTPWHDEEILSKSIERLMDQLTGGSDIVDIEILAGDSTDWYL